MLDTHALLWWSFNPEMLSPGAAAACAEVEASGRAVVSSITLWEIGLKIKNGKLDIGTSIEDYVAGLQSTHLVEIVPVDARTWLTNLALAWEHRDPVDRTIVALATLQGLPILTRDAEIQSFYPRCIW